MKSLNGQDVKVRLPGLLCLKTKTGVLTLGIRILNISPFIKFDKDFITYMPIFDFHFSSRSLKQANCAYWHSPCCNLDCLVLSFLTIDRMKLFRILFSFLCVLQLLVLPLSSQTTVPSTPELSVLLVTDRVLKDSDMLVQKRLIENGHQVTLIADHQVQPSDAEGHDVILISSTSLSTQVGDRLRNVQVPIVCWEPYLYDDLGMTGPVVDTDFGWLPEQTTIHVNGTSSPISVGVFGFQTMYTAPSVMTFAIPVGAPHTIATIDGDPRKPSVFSFRQGAKMVPGFFAPARRVGFFMGDNGPTLLTELGWKMFDAAVLWAADVQPTPVPNQPPTANLVAPFPGTTFYGPAHITLIAEASDTDGAISKVEFFDGGNLIGEDTTAPFTIELNNLPIGVNHFSCRAYDNAGATGDSAVVPIRVIALNKAPVVSLSIRGNTDLTAPSAIQFNAKATDDDGVVTKVEFYNGATLIGTDTVHPFGLKWNNVTAGNYVIVAKAYDNLGATGVSNEISLQVQQPNQPPSAAITNPSAGFNPMAPASVTIQAVASDPDGSVVRVDFLDQDILLGSDTTSPYSFDYANIPEGVHSLTVKVVDDRGGETISDPVVFTVAPANKAPAITISSQAMNLKLKAPASVQLLANATDTDGVVTKVEFYSGDKLLGTDSVKPFGYKWLNLPEGTHQVRGKAFDNHGASTESNVLSIEVSPANQAPQVSITHPTPNINPVAPASVVIAATASDSDGSVTKVEFFNQGLLLGSDTSSPYELAWDAIPAGTHSVTAQATDDNGAVTISDAVVFTVGAPNQLPTVTLASPTTGPLVAPASIELVATAQDADGSIARVNFYNGNTWIGSDTSAPFSLSWNNVPTGTHNISARAIDNQGGPANSNKLKFVVAAPNLPPEVSITEPTGTTSPVAPASVTILANAADEDGSIAKIEFYNGSDLLGSDTTTPYSFVWSNVAAGSHILTVKAFDNQGASAISAPVALVVKAPNQKPTASVSNASTGKLVAPATVQLSATAADADGTIARVQFLNGTSVIGTDTTSPYSFNWNNVAVGTYQITVRAFDNQGANTTSSAISVEVVPPNAAPEVSITEPTGATRPVAPASVTIRANAADADGTVSKVEFYNGTQLLGTDSSTPYAYAWKNIPAGAHSLTARAYDNEGAITTSSAVLLNVDAANQAPTVTISSPTNGALTAPASIQLAASAQDSDGTITKVEFYNGNNLIGTDTSSPYAMTWSNVEAGSYAIKAKAFDNKGASTTSTALNFTVGVPNGAPEVAITSPVANSTGIAPANLNIQANASDANGISKVEFYQNGKLLGTDQWAPFAYNWRGIAVGTYQLTAKAYDKKGLASTSASVTYQVVPANQPPAITISSSSSGLKAPADLQLAATASDSDGRVAKVEFYRGSTLLGSDTTAPYSFTWKAVAKGTYSVRGKAYDDKGASKFSDPISINVGAANRLPKVKVESAIAVTGAYAPATIEIEASASDTDGTINRVEFFDNGTRIGTDTSSPYTFVLTGAGVGTHAITAKAYDNDGGVATSTAVRIVVKTKPNEPPVVSLETIQGTSLVVPATVVLRANTSDADGSVARVEFWADGKRVSTDTAAPYEVAVDSLGAGNHSFFARAFDDKGGRTDSSALILVATMPPTSGGNLTLVANGKANSIIIMENAKHSLTKEAADALQALVFKSTGVRIPMGDSTTRVTAPTVAIRIGDSRAAKALGLNGYSLPWDHFRIKTSGNNVFIIARNTKANALKYAVEHLMDHYAGVRWLWPGEIGTYIPKRTSIMMPHQDYTWEPLGTQRQVADRLPGKSKLLTSAQYSKMYREAMEWQSVFRMNTTVMTITSHNFTDWWHKHSKNHPEYFAHTPAGSKYKQPFEGKPEMVKLCNSNDGVIRQIVADYKREGSPAIWGAGQNDGNGYCICANCLALDEVKGARNVVRVFEGEESLTLRHMKWWKRILTELRKVNPKVKLMIISYGANKAPPPPEWIPNSDYIVTSVSASSPEGKEWWLQWSSKGAEISLRPNWWHTGTHAPWLNFREEGEFTKFAIANGMSGFRQDELKGDWGAQGLRYYTFARLTVRPDLSIEQILEEYCSAFGSAKNLIKQYFNYWDAYDKKAAYPWIIGGFEFRPGPSLYVNAFRKNKVHPHPLNGSYEALHYLYPDSILAPAISILNQADVAAANDPAEVKERIRFLRDGLRHVAQSRDTIWLAFELKRKKKVQAEFDREYKKLVDLRRELSLRHVVWGDAAMNNNARKVPNFPE
jgi:hypothetical protein